MCWATFLRNFCKEKLNGKFKVFQMEDVHFPEVIYAYHGPEMGELIYNNARTT